jgi:hypothetical protein
MPLPGKIPFTALASLLFMFSALGFAPAQCAIKPIKPVPPVGCKDVTPQCVTNSNGQSYWTWICVPNGEGVDAEQREQAARQAEADQRIYDSLGRGIASLKARHWVKKYCQKHPGGSWWYKNPRAGIDAHGVCP